MGEILAFLWENRVPLILLFIADEIRRLRRQQRPNKPEA